MYVQKLKQEKLHVLMVSQQNIYLHSQRPIVVIYISRAFVLSDVEIEICFRRFWIRY